LYIRLFNPHVATAHTLKAQDPQSKVVFIGPCIAKKLEALEEEVLPFVDFVLTYEELMGMFSARSVDLAGLTEEPFRYQASRDGRSYAVAGGVAAAIKNCIAELDRLGSACPKADSLNDCRKCWPWPRQGRPTATC